MLSKHSRPLFKSLEIIKFFDLVTFRIATSMHKYDNHLLPSVFLPFFTKINVSTTITQGLLQNSLIIFQKQEQIMENSI